MGNNKDNRPTKTIEISQEETTTHNVSNNTVTTTRKKIAKIDTEDLLAVGGIIVAIILTCAIVYGLIDLKIGGSIIVLIVGGVAISQVVKARRTKTD